MMERIDLIYTDKIEGFETESATDASTTDSCYHPFNGHDRREDYPKTGLSIYGIGENFVVC